MNVTILLPQHFKVRRTSSFFWSLIAVAILFGLNFISTQANNDISKATTNISQLALSNAFLTGDYEGTLIVSAPVNIGIIDLGLQVVSNGNEATGTLFDPNSTHFSGSPTINALITGSINGITPTFTIQSETFVETISGQEVTRSFSINGELWDDGATLSGLYAEIVTGYTPEPLQLSGQVLLAKSSEVVAQAPAHFLSVEADISNLSPNQTTSVTARLLDSNLQPVTGISAFSFSTNLGEVSPAIANTDSNGVAITTFTSGEIAGQALIDVQADTILGATVIIVNDKTLSLEAGSITLPPNGSTTITARLTDSFGQAVTEITNISFSTNLGMVSPAIVATDSNGFATTTFTAGEQSGLVTIVAQSDSASGSTMVTIETNSSDGEKQIYLPIVLR